jgi:uncharacterized protein
MKFQPDTLGGVNAITRQEPGRVWVGNAVHARSIVVPWVGVVQDWGVAAMTNLTAAHFERLAALDPELVVFGSGSSLRFPSAALLRALIERGIGVETMDTPAACRTFNVLVSERRSVVAALVLEPQEKPPENL